MKHLTIGVIILVLLLAISLLVLWLTDRFLDKTEEPLLAMMSGLEEENTAALLPMITRSCSIWDSYRGFFRSVFSHNDLEEVDQGFAAMKAYAQQGELAELRDTHARMLDMLEHLRTMDRPYYYNILAKSPAVIS